MPQWIWNMSIIYPHFIANTNVCRETACPRTCSVKIVLFNPFSSRLPYTTPMYALACEVLIRTKIFFLQGIFENLVRFCA